MALVLTACLMAPYEGVQSQNPSTIADLVAAAPISTPRLLRVAPGTELSTPSMAANIARDGDFVEIAAGVYEGDAAVWPQNNLTIRGAGGRAQLHASGAHAEGKGIWVIKGDNVSIENVGFSGARVPHRNGAGIRLEGARLRLRHCVFLDNENGILTSTNPLAEIVIEHSEFAFNGDGSGQTHNIYVGGGRSLTIRYSHIHHAIGGHGVKSRAARTDIRYSRIADDVDGESSYEVEFPNGGVAILIGNLIQQSPMTRNFTVVSYGVEGLRHPVNELYAVHNTIISDRPAGGRFFFLAPGTAAARLVNNIYSGKAMIVAGTQAESAGNAILPSAAFVDRTQGDYRPRADVNGLRDTVAPGAAHGISFTPTLEYVHPLSYRQRESRGTLDAGAFAAQ